jgi:uncharacterized membrane protein HdeD (DUF308 family)
MYILFSLFVLAAGVLTLAVEVRHKGRPTWRGYGAITVALFVVVLTLVGVVTGSIPL